MLVLDVNISEFVLYSYHIVCFNQLNLNHGEVCTMHLFIDVHIFIYLIYIQDIELKCGMQHLQHNH